MSLGTRPVARGSWWWSILLAGVGMAGSGYLLARTFALLMPSGHAAFDVCSALFATSCDGTLTDERFWIVGVPLAGMGLVYFSTLAALLALARFVEGTFEARALIAASALSAAGVAVGLALTIGALSNGTPLCPMCVSVHAVSLALLIALQRAIGRSLPEQLRLVREGWNDLVRDGGVVSESARWQLVGFGCAALIATVAWQWVYVESALRRPASPPLDRRAAIAAWATTPQQTLPVSARDPHRGPLDAPVQLVVFESFQCPHCQRFEGTLSRLEHEFGARLLVVFKNYPLSSRCNDRLSVDAQPDACEIAWAAEAAHRQARFWPFHDAMLAAGSRASAAVIEQAAHGAGLESQRFEADRRSAAVRERVDQDIALGNQLKIPGTPAIYLDGRLVSPATAELLEILIRHELERRATRTPAVDREAGAPGRLDAARRPPKDG